MKTFRRNSKSEVVCIDLEAKKKADRSLKAPPQPISPLTIKEEEDCAFGSLVWFFTSDKQTLNRMKIFNKM